MRKGASILVFTNEDGRAMYIDSQEVAAVEDANGITIHLKSGTRMKVTAPAQNVAEIVEIIWGPAE
jgi:hypothetical protein